MIKKLLIPLLAAVVAVTAFVSCTNDGTEDPVTTSADSSDTAAPEEQLLVLIENGETDFRIIRSEHAQGYYLDTASAVYQRAKETLSSYFKLSEDWFSPLDPIPADAHEILLFSTNREESVQAMADLDIEGYLIRITDCKVVIVGSSPAACNEALYHFFDYLIPDYTKDGVTAFPVGLEVKREFSASDFDIGEALRAGKTVCADFNVVFEYSGIENFRVAQGAATDGKYAYVAMKDGSGAAEVDKIVKIDMESWSIVATSETFPLDHANDMTYDPELGQLIVVNMLDNVISFIDAETLALVKQTALPFGTWATGYVDGASRYAFLAYGTPSGLVITDRNFNPIFSAPHADSTGFVGQGMDADEKYAYVPLSPNTGKYENVIQIYDITTGEFLGIIHVDTKMESESMFHVGEKHYMHFNSRGSQIAELEFYVRFK